MGIREAWRRLRALARIDTLEHGIDEEIRFHIDRQTEKNVRAGMTPDEARRRAFIAFGGVEHIKERTRDEYRPALLQDSLRDLRHGARALRRTPGFTAAAVATLALGIGATTAIFTVVNGVLLRPLPYPDADALVSLDHTAPGASAAGRVGMSAALLSTYADENQTFQQLGLWSRSVMSVTGGDEPEEVENLFVSQGTLPALGVQPTLGRWFAPEDHLPGSPDTVILTYGYWQRRYGGDASVVGRRLIVNSRPRTVVGVMPQGFRFFEGAPEIVLPLQFAAGDLTLGRFNYSGIARLAPGADVEKASADVARMLPIWLHAWPSFPGMDRAWFEKARLTPALRPLKPTVVGDVGRTLWVLMGTIAVVLVIACANVANLVLVRAEGRQHEIAVRAALGAGRFRLAREMLLESVILGGVSGALGLGLASAGLRLLVTLGPASLPRLQEIALGPAAFALALALSTMAVLLIGGIAIVRQAGVSTMPSMRVGDRTSSDSKEKLRTRDVLVVVQVALALVLLVASGLMIRTFVALRAVAPGFADPHHVQLVRLTIPHAQVAEPDQVYRMQIAIRDRIAAISGVTAASFTAEVPMSGTTSRSVIQSEDHPVDEAGAAQVIRWFRFVSPGYFRTIGTPLVAGRDFTETDVDEHRLVAVVSENLARELWRDPAAAIGKRIRETTGSPWREIVGVVGNINDNGLRQEAPTTVYWPSLMERFNGSRATVQRAVSFAIRSDRAGTEALLDEVRRAVWSINANLPLARINTLGDVYDKSLASTSFALVMLALAGGAALLLGIVGIYGVIAYSVTQRTREIGIRAALGARHGELKTMFVRHGVTLALVGVTCGLAGAAVLMRLMVSLLFATSPLDLSVYVSVSVGLVVVAALASYLPACGATRIDPVLTLRGE